MFSGQVILEFFYHKEGEHFVGQFIWTLMTRKKQKNWEKKEEKATSGSVLKTFKALGALKKLFKALKR